MWKILLTRREVLNAGLIWIIGNRRTTRIWKDQWITKPVTSMIKSLVVRFNENTMVAKLINESIL